MRQRRFPLAIACVAGMSLLAAGAVSTAGDLRTTIRLLEVTRAGQMRLVDHNRNHRPDPGDFRVETSDLYRWAGASRGAHVGRVEVICTLATRRAGNCRGTFLMADGNIQTQGFVDYGDGVNQVAVVGGTGAYLGVRGSLTSREIGGSSSDQASDTIHLLR